MRQDSIIILLNITGFVITSSIILAVIFLIRRAIRNRTQRTTPIQRSRNGQGQQRTVDQPKAPPNRFSQEKPLHAVRHPGDQRPEAPSNRFSQEKPKDIHLHIPNEATHIHPRIPPVEVALEQSYNALTKHNERTYYIKKHHIQYLYHLTAIDNLPSIMKYGLLSHNEAYRRNLVSTDISDPNVQHIRRHKKDTVYNRPLHDYVCLYFSPKNPMLYKRIDLQERVAILAIDPYVLLGNSTIFSDGNAASSATQFYNDLQKLDHLNWITIEAQYWKYLPDGKRRKCAEVLVYQRVPVETIHAIFCYSLNAQREITRLLPKQIKIPIIVRRDLYF